MGRLFNIDVKEVSLVDVPANKKKFCLMKRADVEKQERWETPEDISDGHIHTVVSLDPMGNGKTDSVNGHSHEVKEFVVVDYISETYVSRHSGKVMEKETHPDEEEMEDMMDEMPEEVEEDDKMDKKTPAEILSSVLELISELKTMMEGEAEPEVDEDEEAKPEVLKAEDKSGDKQVDKETNSSAKVEESSATVADKPSQVSASSEDSKTPTEPSSSLGIDEEVLGAFAELIAEVNKIV